MPPGAADLLIPVHRCRSREGVFRWPERPVLCSPFAADDVPLHRLAETLKQHTGARPRVGRDPTRPHALLVRRHGGLEDPEEYRLRIDRAGIEILAPTAAAAYYALQTLRELVRVHGHTLPCCRVQDAPDFRRRGVYLDCSRGKVPTVATLKRLVEYLAALKLNELQLYVENVFTFPSHPEIGRGFSPFTPRELLAVQDHCNLHHVRFVPSLASFGHVEKILALPAYRRLGEKAGGGGTTLCPTDPGAVRLMADLYGDFLPLFEAADFNACGDEPWELGKGRSRRRCAKTGAGRVYMNFVKKLHTLCVRHGKRMNLWADIVLHHPEVLTEIPGDIVLLNWDYHPEGQRIPRTRELAEAGLEVVVCPGTNGWKSHGTRLRTAMENVRVFAKTGRRYAAAGLLNTDWGDGGHRNPLGASFHGYAHGAAHAWHGRGVREDTFTETFCFHVLGTQRCDAAAALRTLGGVERETRCIPYHLVGTSVATGRGLTQGIPAISPVRVGDGLAGEADEAACRRLADSVLPQAASALAAVAARDPFARIVVEDLQLAAQLDRVGCGKAPLVRAAAAGDTPSPAACRALARLTRDAAEQFVENWRKRNKPSRLRDNRQLLRNGERELLRLAGGAE